MAHLFHVFTIIFLFFSFTLAAPTKFKSAGIAIMAVHHMQNQTPIFRKGGKNDVIGGAVRAKDWHKHEDGTVHAHDTKGLSFRKGVPPNHKEVLHTIKPAQLKGTEFKVVHDGLGGPEGHAAGHATLAYKGPPVTDKQLKEKLRRLPFEKKHPHPR
jgi:hypothetical protein